MVKNLVCDRELAERLRELGYPQDSVFWWWKDDFSDWVVLSAEELPDVPKNAIEPERFIAAPTAGELGEKMPDHLGDLIEHVGRPKWLTCQKVGMWEVGYTNYDGHSFESPNLANAMAKMMIFLAEKGLIKF